MAVDPVCRMEVDEDSNVLTAVFQGDTFYFCSPACKDAFKNEPMEYLR